ncbi:MAG: hypothetical protein H6R18_1261 [Proteobacteria bacterium]|nr:hypothetical protein [Pseudomonadota bacterium]
MELRDCIESGIKRKTTVTALATYLGVNPNSISDAKAHRRGLPNDACVKLARLIGAEPLDVIAASELATEKKTEKREFWLSFVNPAKTARVAGYALILTCVTSFVTPSPAEAAPLHNMTMEQFVLC